MIKYSRQHVSDSINTFRFPIRYINSYRLPFPLHADELIPVTKRPAFHLLIGSRLFLKTPTAELDDSIFDIVGNMNIGLHLIRSQYQRHQVANLNLRAGMSAFSHFQLAHIQMFTFNKRLTLILAFFPITPQEKKLLHCPHFVLQQNTPCLALSFLTTIVGIKTTNSLYDFTMLQQQLFLS